MPFGRGRKIAGSSNAFADAIIGGWQLGAIYQAQGGAPLGIGDNVLTGPCKVQDLVLQESERKPERYDNSNVNLNKVAGNAFVFHLNQTSARFGALRSDGINQMDLSIAK